MVDTVRKRGTRLLGANRRSDGIGTLIILKDSEYLALPTLLIAIRENGRYMDGRMYKIEEMIMVVESTMTVA